MSGYKEFTWDQVDPFWIKIVQGLANDKTVKEVAKEMEYNVRTLEKKVFDLKETFQIKTIGGLIALFFRNNLIK